MPTGSELIRRGRTIRRGSSIGGLVFVLLNSGCDYQQWWNRAIELLPISTREESQIHHIETEDRAIRPIWSSGSTTENAENRARNYARCRNDLWVAHRRARAASQREPPTFEASDMASCTAAVAAKLARTPAEFELETAMRALMARFRADLDTAAPPPVDDDSQAMPATWLEADENFQLALDRVYAPNDEAFLRLIASREDGVSYHVHAIAIAARQALRCREREIRKLAATPSEERPRVRKRGWSDECRHRAEAFDNTWTAFHAALEQHPREAEAAFWLDALLRAADGFRVELRATLEESRRLRPDNGHPLPTAQELDTLRTHAFALMAASDWVETSRRRTQE